MGIMNYSQLIMDNLGPESEYGGYAAEIGMECERVAAIVKNLLGFSRQGQMTHSATSICDIVQSVLSLIRTVVQNDQISIEVNVQDDLPRITCCYQQIEQVVMNLLTNARDASNERYEGFDEKKKVIRLI